MSGLNLNSWTENATRLGMRIQETLAERTKDFSLTSSGAGYYDTGEDKTKNIKTQLDSGNEREKLEAMKCLIAMISKGRNVSEYFVQVVKNVAAPSLEVRKLVYIYLLRYAEAEPDLALLSINTFQRDLADSSPLIRAMALRVLSGIPVPTISSLVVLAIKKCATDSSPYVRKAAALSIPKCYSLDDSQLPSLIAILLTLLRDRSPLSIGSVATAFEAVCPTRLDLLHPHYRRLCRVLVDVDEWGQVNLLELLIRYARTMLPRPTTSHDDSPEKEKEDVDPDLELLLVSAEPLFQSRNPAVVMSVTRAFYYLALPSRYHGIVHPLLRLLAVSPEIERVVLAYILSISHTAPHLFSPHYTRFIIRADDSTQLKGTKTRLLRNLVTVDNCQALLREFIDYTDDVDETLVAEAIQGIGHIARTLPELTTQCLNALLACIKSPHDCVVSNAVVELKSLVQTQMQGATHAGPSLAPLTIVERLAYRINEIRHAHARACIVWLVGQYAADDSPSAVVEGVAPWAPDILRKIAKSFRDEARGPCYTRSVELANMTVPVKLQAVTLAAKLLVLSPTHGTLTQLAKYVFALARYDRNYDVRDRGRMLQQLLVGVVPSISAVDAKDVGGVVLRRPQGKENAAPRGAHEGGGVGVRERLGTLGLVLGRDVPHARLLPDWLEHGVESSLRHSPDDAPSSTSAVTAIGHVAPSRGGIGVGMGTGTGGRSTPIVVLTPAGSGGPSPAGSVPNRAGWTNLDKFYASDSEEEEEEEEEDEGEGEERGSEEDGDEEDGERSEEENDRQSRDEGDSRAAPEVDEDEESDVELRRH
ncbi:adaptin N terminal region-domain-containing protein [Russula dissimulans]|nr:adaptin N terminal region-domain-containing protein [Russula dissimulans]